VKELLKSVHICQSYCKNKSGIFLWPTVLIQQMAFPIESVHRLYRVGNLCLTVI